MTIFSFKVLSGLDPGYCWELKNWESYRQLHLSSRVELPFTEVKSVWELELTKSQGLKTTFGVSMLRGKHSVQPFDISLGTKP